MTPAPGRVLFFCCISTPELEEPRFSAGSVVGLSCCGGVGVKYNLQGYINSGSEGTQISVVYCLDVTILIAARTLEHNIRITIQIAIDQEK